MTTDTTPVIPLAADRLLASEIAAIQKDTVERHPGVWLHHYGRAIEEAVLRHHGIAFEPITVIGQ